MSAPIASRLTRRGLTKEREAKDRRRAEGIALRVIHAALEGLSGSQLEHVSDALMDMAINAHAGVFGPTVTAPRCAAKAGQIYPYTPPNSRRDIAEAKFAARQSGRAA